MMPDQRGLGDLLGNLVDWLPEGLVVVNETGSIVFANPRAEAMFGYPPGGLNGLRVEALVPEGLRSKHTAHRMGFIGQAHARAMTGNLNLRGRRLDGSTFPIDVFLGPTRSDDGVYVLAAVRDITHRWQLERELRKHDEQVRQLAETVPTVLWIASPSFDVIHYVNPAYEALWGRPCADLYERPMSWLDGVLEADRAGALELLGQPPGERTPDDPSRVTTRPPFAFRIQRPDGEVRWAEARSLAIPGDEAQVSRIAGIIEDVTDRKRFEEMLHRAHERLETEVEQRTAALRLANERLRTEAAQRTRVGNWLWEIFESLPDAMFIINPSGEIVGVNRTGCELLGYERGELLGREIDVLIPAASRAAHHRHVADYFRRPRTRPMGSVLDLSAVRKDGRAVPVDIALAPLDTGSGAFVVAAVRDITARRRDEQALRDSRERLELAVQGSNTGIWDWDLRTGEIYFSPRWKGLLGFEDDEVANDFEEWRSRLHPDDRERALAAVGRYLDGHAPSFELDYRLRHRDGSYRWILSRGVGLREGTGRFHRMIGTNIDLTEQKQTELAHQAAAAKIHRGRWPVAPPTVPGFAIDGRGVPAEPCSGAFFDYLSLPDGSLAAVLADVSGRGLTSAVAAATCQATLRTLADSHSEPTHIIERLNRRLHLDAASEAFACLVLARIDPANRTLTCVNASHAPALVLDREGRLKARLESAGPPLGVAPNLALDSGPPIVLDPGDLVLLVSDGLLAAWNRPGESSGVDGLLATVRDHLGAPPSQLAEALHEAACRQARAERLTDDAIAVVVKAESLTPAGS